MNRATIAALLLAAFALSGCDEDGAKSALLDAGYVDPQITGYVFFGCGEHDLFHNGFTAKGPTGRTVHGVVCSGPLKGYTIRMF